MRRQALSAAALAVVAVLAVGCDDSGSDSADKPDDSPSTSEQTSSDDADGSGVSDGSKNADAAGAEAYARRFVQVVNRAGDTGDTKALHDLVAMCSPCQQYPATYDDMYANGGSVDGEFYKLVDVRASVRDDSTAQAIAKVKANTSTTFKLNKKRKPQNIRAETYVWTLELERVDNGWQVTGMKEKF